MNNHHEMKSVVDGRINYLAESIACLQREAHRLGYMEAAAILLAAQSSVLEQTREMRSNKSQISS